MRVRDAVLFTLAAVLGACLAWLPNRADVEYGRRAEYAGAVSYVRLCAGGLDSALVWDDGYGSLAEAWAEREGLRWPPEGRR